MKKAWWITKTILNNIFRIAVSLIVIVVFVGFSPIIALVLVGGWLIDNWSKLKPDDFLKIGANNNDESNE